MSSSILKLVLTVFFVVVSLNLFAQQTVVEQVPMADQMRADGKIWIVVVVIAVVFSGIIAFLINTDRKLTRLEKQLKK